MFQLNIYVFGFIIYLLIKFYLKRVNPELSSIYTFALFNQFIRQSLIIGFTDLINLLIEVLRKDKPEQLTGPGLSLYTLLLNNSDTFSSSLKQARLNFLSFMIFISIVYNIYYLFWFIFFILPFRLIFYTLISILLGIDLGHLIRSLNEEFIPHLISLLSSLGDTLINFLENSSAWSDDFFPDIDGIESDYLELNSIEVPTGEKNIVSTPTPPPTPTPTPIIPNANEPIINFLIWCLIGVIGISAGYILYTQFESLNSILLEGTGAPSEASINTSSSVSSNNNISPSSSSSTIPADYESVVTACKQYFEAATAEANTQSGLKIVTEWIKTQKSLPGPHDNIDNPFQIEDYYTD